MRDDAGCRHRARDRATRLCVKGRGSATTEPGRARARRAAIGPVACRGRERRPRHLDRGPPPRRGVEIFQPSTVGKKIRWAVWTLLFDFICATFLEECRFIMQCFAISFWLSS